MEQLHADNLRRRERRCDEDLEGVLEAVH